MKVKLVIVTCTQASSVVESFGELATLERRYSIPLMMTMMVMMMMMPMILMIMMIIVMMMTAKVIEPESEKRLRPASASEPKLFRKQTVIVIECH